MTSRETTADITGQRLSRDERKALRIADLRECPPERLAELRVEAERAIRHLEECRVKQQKNGIPVSDQMHKRNTASHVLMLECLDAIA